MHMPRFLASLLYLLSIQAPPQEGTCFPGEHQSMSPAGMRITYKWAGELHHLFFERARRDTPVRLLTFERSACVHWSPRGDFFALTNYAGSNISIVEIVSTEDSSKRVRISDVLPPAAKTLMAGALQRYSEVISWDSAGLVVRVHGELKAEPGEFDLRVRCTFESPRWSCSMP
jgi:hypothetical protein